VTETPSENTPDTSVEGAICELEKVAEEVLGKEQALEKGGALRRAVEAHVAENEAHSTLAFLAVIAEQLRVANIIAWYGDSPMPEHVQDEVKAAMGVKT
jgi:hypothetical protein